MRLHAIKPFIFTVLAVVTTLLLAGCPSTEEEYYTTGKSQYSPEEMDQLNQETIERIITLARQVENYLVDHPEVGAPKADDINMLKQVLVENGYGTEELPTEDAFGNTLVYRHHFSDHPMNRRDYDIISLGEDGVQDLWKVTDHIRDTFYGQDIVWRHQSAVNDRSGFIHGPSLIRRQFSEHIAPPPEDVKMEY
jgi:hypothetical protein